MKKNEFDEHNIIGDGLLSLDRQQLCNFICALCDSVKADAGPGVYRGGIFPDNISLNEDNSLSLGPAKKDDWTGQELDFIAPELYWNGKPSPAADVYSIGLIMYYAVSRGKLPFDGECKDPQLRRMGGAEFPIPKAAGGRLSQVIKKATAFKAADRYQSMDELKAVTQACLKNLYLHGAPCAETIFKKNDDSLSEIEKMMVNIIERDEDKPMDDEKVEEKVIDEVAESEPTQDEFPAGNDSAPVQDVGPDVSDEDAAEAFSKHDRIPHLYVEDNPELEPVTPEIVPPIKYTTTNEERKRRMEEEKKKRNRRPVALILVLCAILVVVSIVFNAVIRDIKKSGDELQAQIDAAQEQLDMVNQQLEDQNADAAEPEVPEATATPEPVFEDTEITQTIKPDGSENSTWIPGQGLVSEENSPLNTADPEAVEFNGHTYKLFIKDISWTDAQAKCKELGGYLAVINSADEFNAIVDMAEAKGVVKLWIGGHRVDNTIVWEDGSTAPYEQWAKGEPSFVDVSDGAAEDYVMLWFNNGWFYNDNRNDPCGEFPQWYSGSVAYICEFDK